MDVFGSLERRGFVQQVTHRDEVAAQLAAGPVTFYIGFDPTADSLHVGSLLQLILMRRLQDAGHKAIAVVGGGTARVGDPSGRSELRQMLDDATLAANSEGIRQQIARIVILDGERGRMVDNADWLLGLNYIGFLRDIGRHFSVNKMLSAEAYKQRLEKGLSFIEFNYQILQAYDFLELFRRHGCTLQIGGDDQWGNILAGVDLIRRVDQAPSNALTTPLITTASGAKMGKTAAGAVWLDAAKTPPFDFYQYWINTDDRDVKRFLALYTLLDDAEVARLGALEGAEIREAKRVLAHELTAMIHGEEAAVAARRGAEAMVAGRADADLPSLLILSEALSAGAKIHAVLVDAGLVKSRGEGRKMIANGGVTLNNVKVTDAEAVLPPDAIGEGGAVLRVGRQRAVRLVAGD
jgi:tyrosyl-tRNA synthetase